MLFRSTTEHPESQWVLASVVTFDGFTNDAPDGALGTDVTAARFTYAGGRFDRREREFYGHADEVREELDTTGRDESTALAAPVYARSVEESARTAGSPTGCQASERTRPSAPDRARRTRATPGRISSAA